MPQKLTERKISVAPVCRKLPRACYTKWHSKSYCTFLQERGSFVKKLDDAEEWLYDEGEDQIKSVYQGKLESLKVRLDLFLREEFFKLPFSN
jgi:hypothetical protein